jgi:hypothetical protein
MGAYIGLFFKYCIWGWLLLNISISLCFPYESTRLYRSFSSTLGTIRKHASLDSYGINYPRCKPPGHLSLKGQIYDPSYDGIARRKQPHALRNVARHATCCEPVNCLLSVCDTVVQVKYKSGFMQLVLYKPKAFVSCPTSISENTKWYNVTSQKTNMYMYKVMYTIYSDTFQNRQTLKSLAKISLYILFFPNPLGNLLYLDCTIYVYYE